MKIVEEELEKRRSLMNKMNLTDQKLIDKQYEMIEADN